MVVGVGICGVGVGVNILGIGDFGVGVVSMGNIYIVGDGVVGDGVVVCFNGNGVVGSGVAGSVVGIGVILDNSSRFSPSLIEVSFKVYILSNCAEVSSIGGSGSNPSVRDPIHMLYNKRFCK